MATIYEVRLEFRKQLKLTSSSPPSVVGLIFPEGSIGDVERSVFEPCWTEEDVRIQLTKWIGPLDLSQTAFRSLNGALRELLLRGRLCFDEFDITYDRKA
jgi:hypothetical protein